MYYNVGLCYYHTNMFWIIQTRYLRPSDQIHVRIWPIWIETLSLKPYSLKALYVTDVLYWIIKWPQYVIRDERNIVEILASLTTMLQPVCSPLKFPFWVGMSAFVLACVIHRSPSCQIRNKLAHKHIVLQPWKQANEMGSTEIVRDSIWSQKKALYSTLHDQSRAKPQLNRGVAFERWKRQLRAQKFSQTDGELAHFLLNRLALSFS